MCVRLCACPHPLREVKRSDPQRPEAAEHGEDGQAQVVSRGDHDEVVLALAVAGAVRLRGGESTQVSKHSKKHSKTLAAVSSSYSGYLFFSFMTCFECFILKWCDYHLQNHLFLVFVFLHTQLDMI